MDFDIFGNAEGVGIESYPEDKTMPTGLFQNGFYRQQKTPVGKFTYKVAEAPKGLGLSKTEEFRFERNEDIPKPPYAIFTSILQFYRDVYKEIKSEVYTLIVYDKELNDFLIHVPQQEVSGASVKYQNDDWIINDPRYVLFADIHSHNVMGAFFSSTDVQDEVGARYFGVIGEIDKDPAKYVMKVAYNRQFINQTLEDVFDFTIDKLNPDSDYSLNYEQLKDRIVERVSTYSYGGVTKVTNKFQKGTVKKPVKTYPQTFGYGNYDDDYDDYYSGYNYNTGYNKNYNDPKYNLAIGTKFYNDTAALDTFIYDFTRVFPTYAYGNLRDQDFLNLIDSFATLLFDEHEIDDELMAQFVSQLYDTWGKCEANWSNPLTLEDDQIEIEVGGTNE